MTTPSLAPNLSIIIPCYNEEASITNTVKELVESLAKVDFSYEILCVNNASVDKTEQILQKLSDDFPTVRYINTPKIAGFGVAVRWGLEHYTGEAVVVAMADGAEPPSEIIDFYGKIREGYDCAFGSRFITGSSIEEYPWIKLAMNRMGNKLISFIVDYNYTDFTNGFKCYRRETIDAMQPLFSEKFNLAIEMSINAVTAGARIAVLPNTQRGRSAGVSKFNISQQAPLYLATLFYCVLRKRMQGKSWASFCRALTAEREQKKTFDAQRTKNG